MLLFGTAAAAVACRLFRCCFPLLLLMLMMKMWLMMGVLLMRAHHWSRIAHQLIDGKCCRGACRCGNLRLAITVYITVTWGACNSTVLHPATTLRYIRHVVMTAAVAAGLWKGKAASGGRILLLLMWYMSGAGVG